MRDWIVHALAAVMALTCAALCGMHTADLRAFDECAHRPLPVLRTCDLPVVRYPATREFAVHGTPVTLCFAGERFVIEPTREELRYGMRWSWEP